MKAIPRLKATREMGLLVLLAVICVGFGAADENFRDPYNFLDRTRQWAEIGMIAVPMTFIIATAGIDLSVGSLVAMSSIVAGLCFQTLGLPLPVALACGVLAGAAGGALNATATCVLRVPPLVVTLATMAMFRGLAMGLSQADPIGGFPRWFTDWGSLSAVGAGDYQVPYQTILLVLLVGVGAFVFRSTCVGRWTVEIGENPKAARFSTIPVNRLLFAIYTACGLVCGLAAVIHTARFATAHPGAAAGLELEVIACVVVGGTRITGGNGSVIGTFLGVLILGSLRFGMDMLGVVQQWQIILVGFLVIDTAIFNEWLARRNQEAVRPASSPTV
ncbi:MAG: ABC transporter permease [Planctomycetota bacterium]